jgi:hypothetical protein
MLVNRDLAHISIRRNAASDTIGGEEGDEDPLDLCWDTTKFRIDILEAGHRPTILMKTA